MFIPNESAMKFFNTTQAKHLLKQTLDIAQQEPVIIQKHRKYFAVLLSSARYSELLAYEDKYLHNLAVLVEKEGFIGTEASRNLLDSI
ncbi:hypothetical protein EQU24_20315 [Methylotuvimicrobium buryatense]|uniref:Antitoxin n=2 Tax=Methylotuvimicrobium buryatense TaxID=95641 RepID=A0A4P9US18_METBY|nr:hypothetical protein EQU24_20315 [Methylotuvimicrobium buryatense]